MFPDSMVRDWPKLFRLDSPRIWVTWESATVMFEANIEAVILRQSVQLQTKVLMRPGLVVGWWGVSIWRAYGGDGRRVFEK